MLYAADTPAGWLHAGQALLQRVLLTATVRGVATTLMTQPAEIPQLRDLLSEPRTDYPAQAVIRLGYDRRPGRSTPRRPLSEVLLDRP